MLHCVCKRTEVTYLRAYNLVAIRFYPDTEQKYTMKILHSGSMMHNAEWSSVKISVSTREVAKMKNVRSRTDD